MHLTSIQVKRKLGVEKMLENIVSAKKLRWMDPVARIDDSCLPKKLLFGWLPQQRPAHEIKQWWRDIARKDLKQFRIDEKSWFHLTQDKGQWRAVCKHGLDTYTKEEAKEGATEEKLPLLLLAIEHRI